MNNEHKVDANISPEFKEVLGDLVNQIETLSLSKAQADIDNGHLRSRIAELEQQRDEAKEEFNIKLAVLSKHVYDLEQQADKLPLCQQPGHPSGEWPCPEICGEMCVYNNTDKCVKRSKT